MRFCTKCIMPDTRPGITFNEKGVCIACQNNERKKNIDWDSRMEELKALCDKYRRTDNTIASLQSAAARIVIIRFM